MNRLALVVGLAGAVMFGFVRRLFKGPKHPRWSLQFELFAEGIRHYMLLHERYVTSGGRDKGGLATAKVPRSIAAHVAFAKTTFAGLPSEMHTPHGWDPSQPTVLYFHGGGYVSCSPGTHRELIARIAHASGARCIAPDYRLAPEAPFPAAIEDALRCYRELLASGTRPEQVFLAGDSAGGGLCLAALQRLRAGGESLPRAALLLSPWVDLEASAPSIQSNARFDYLRHGLLTHAAAQYCAGHPLRDGLISPLHADLEGLPPLLVQSGSAELFLAENEQFVARARAAGVAVTHEIEDGMVHVFQLFAGFFPEPRPAIESLGRFVRAHAQPAAQPEREPAPLAMPVSA